MCYKEAGITMKIMHLFRLVQYKIKMKATRETKLTLILYFQTFTQAPRLELLAQCQL